MRMSHGSCEKQTARRLTVDGVHVGERGGACRGLPGEPSCGSEPGKSHREEETIAQELSPWSWGRKVSSAGLFVNKLLRLPGGPRAKVEGVLLLPGAHLPSGPYLRGQGGQPWEVWPPGTVPGCTATRCLRSGKNLLETQHCRVFFIQK